MKSAWRKRHDAFNEDLPPLVDGWIERRSCRLSLDVDGKVKSGEREYNLFVQMRLGQNEAPAL